MTVGPLDTGYLRWMALIFLAGGLPPVLMRERPKPHFVPHSQRGASTYTVMITIFVTVSKIYVLDNAKVFGGVLAIAAMVITIGYLNLAGL